MKVNSKLLLKISFLIGVVADFIVAVNWLLISLGYEIPSIISGHQSTGANYQFVVFICSLFMFGWTAILFWGYLQPEERRGLLLITSIMLIISIVGEIIFFFELLYSTGFVIGVLLRVALISKFSFSYFYSKKQSIHTLIEEQCNQKLIRKEQ